MKIISHPKTLQKIISQSRRRGKSVGFVPTMGYLHEGHISLIKKCRRENDIAVLSIFINPAQFGPGEDFQIYPRDKKNDVLLAKKENIDIIFYPSVEMMYAGRYLTYIEVEDITKILCGASRPGHFRGVTTIVGKLLNIVQPQRMYLGQKDAQQCVVIKQMVKDLHFPVQVKVLPTVRERDGLALSSRNCYLSATEREEAAVLYKTLKSARQKILDGEKDAKKICRYMRVKIGRECHANIDYIACVDAETLQSVSSIEKTVVLALAVKFRHARLIDNVTVHLKH